MRELLFVFIVFLLLLGLTAYRYRRQLRFAFEIWRTMKTIRDKSKESLKESGVAGKFEKSDNLVSCSKCGKWTPENSSIKFGPNLYYCSTACLHNKARV